MPEQCPSSWDGGNTLRWRPSGLSCLWQVATRGLQRRRRPTVFRRRSSGLVALAQYPPLPVLSTKLLHLRDRSSTVTASSRLNADTVAEAAAASAVTGSWRYASPRLWNAQGI